MDQTAGVCHFKKVGIGEKKIWVEEVMELDARLWDPPQGEGDYNTLASYAQGGYILYAAFYRLLLIPVNPFWIQLPYIIIVSFLGYLALKVSMPKGGPFRPKSFDLFFMSASASTLSSMSTIEMEVFSNAQLIIFTLLMFLCGEVFVSMLGLQLMKFKFTKEENSQSRVHSASNSTYSLPEVLELGSVTHQHFNIQRPKSSKDSEDLKYKSIKALGYMVLSYLLVVHILGSSLVALCIHFVNSSKQVLKKKGLSLVTFSIFTTVSTFSNSGFVPTNENMAIFKKNTALLLILIPQVLLGNTLYPPCLRVFIGFLGRFTKREECNYILKNWRDLGYDYFFSRLRCWFLGGTVLGFILVMFVGFCAMEWNSKVMEGLSNYEKVVGTFFVVVNARHAGESIFDFSIVSPALLVLLVFMM
ncbi:hypothetical protein LguiA_025822 [Lonicera macranthoides]